MGERRPGPDRVVIVGAGFGGLACGRALASGPLRGGRGGAGVEVTLVDQRNFHTFQPLLYQVATAGLNAADVAYPVRAVFHRHGRAARAAQDAQDAQVAFRHATVTGVDWAQRVVHARPDGGGDLALPFDHLVLAPGAVANDFGIPGVSAHGFPLYTLRDAARLRNHVLGRFEAVAADPPLVDDGALTIVVAGGGPTGVEVAGALAELVARVLRKDFPEVAVSAARIVLVEAGDDVLAAFSSRSRRHARDRLRRSGVDVRVGTAVASVGPTRVRFAGGEELPAHTLVWAAGVKVHPLVAALGLPTGRGGRAEVGPHLDVPGHPGVYVVGDAARPTGPDGQALPQVAQPAIQGGRHVAACIAASVEGRPPPAPFRYHDKGIMATIGRNAAVAEFPNGWKLRGRLGWLSWLGLHLVYLIGFRNRLSVLLNWSWNYLTWDRGPRLIFGPDGRDAADPGVPVRPGEAPPSP